MLKEVVNNNYEKYYEGNTKNILKETLYMTKADANNPGKELKAVLHYKDIEVISISLVHNKGSVVLNEEAIAVIFKKLSLLEFEELYKEFVDDFTNVCTKIYHFNIVNKNYFWNEITNINKKVDVIFMLCKDKRSLFYRWSTLPNEKKNAFAKHLAFEYKEGIFNKETGYISYAKYDVINELRAYPKIIISKLLDYKILLNEEDSIQIETLLDIVELIIEKMI